MAPVATGLRVTLPPAAGWGAPEEQRFVSHRPCVPEVLQGNPDRQKAAQAFEGVGGRQAEPPGLRSLCFGPGPVLESPE